MPDTKPTRLRRLFTALKMGQEPKDRLWAVIYVLIALVMLVGALIISHEVETQHTADTSTNMAFERGSVDCLSVIVDSDRTFQLPLYCQRSEVVVYYPPEVCDEFFHGSDLCGRDWEGG